MAVPFILAACFVGVFCLAPLAVYLLWLASVHRRGRPAVLSGGGDLSALLAGLFGFLLAGAVVTLTMVQSGFRAWSRGNFVQLKANWDNEYSVWLLTVCGYGLTLALAAAWSFYLRRRSLVVYNVSPAATDGAVTAVLAGAGRSASRFGDRWADPAGDLVAVRPFHALNHVTVSILARDRRLAEEIGRQLRSAFAATPPAGGVVGAWISSAAWSCGLTAVCCFGLLLYYIYLSAGR